jgi:alpha-glucoside transport system substrate-binding protein
MAKRTTRRGTVALSGAVSLALALAACGGGEEAGDTDAGGEAPSGDCAAYEQYGTFDGAEINVYTGIRDAEGETLASSFEEFAECTDTEVNYEGSGEFEAQLTVRVEGGNAPEIAFLPQPGLLQRFAESGDLVPASDAVRANAEANWNPEWLEYGSHNGEFYAPPLGANVKSFVWYSPTAFAEAGYEVPTTLDELMALSEQIAADHPDSKPWCAGIESGDATGWPATDWLEDYMLRVNGPEVYDQWVSHEIPFNDPQVVAAAEAAAEILKNPDYVNGGLGDVQSITTTAFQDAGLPILDGQCWMHRQASFYAANWPEGTNIGEDGDVFAFYFPAESAEGEQPVLGAGEFVGTFSDEPHVQAFQEYLSSPEYIQKRAELTPGSWVTAAKGLDPGIYESPIDQLSYETLQDPNAVFRFDASDLMPAEVGAGSFWRGMTDWINGAETQAVLDDIEASWPTN